METEEIAFPGAGVQLSGTITCPDAARACPGVVLIGGSGPSDRHNGGFFDALRTHLAGAGVAVLAYDKRGAGKSTGVWAAATADDLAHDAAAAVAALQAHPKVAARTMRPQQTIVFPGADHRLQVTAGFAPGYLTRLSTWCKDHRASAQSA